MQNKVIVIFGSLSMALAVGIGAFGAHGLSKLLIANERTDTFETAVIYHLIHGLALLLLAVLPIPNKKIPAILLIAGIIFFSGSLYVLSVTNYTLLGALAPVGGLCFIVAWLTIARSAFKY